MNRSTTLSTPAVTVCAVLAFAGIYGGGLVALYFGQTLFTAPADYATVAAVVGVGALTRRPVAYWADEDDTEHELTLIEPTHTPGCVLVHFVGASQASSVVPARHVLVRGPVERFTPHRPVGLPTRVQRPTFGGAA